MKITADGIKLKVIGNEEPIGICGSGILAVVKELLKVGLVRKEGAFIKLKQLRDDDYRRNIIQQNGIKREFVMTESPQKLLITQGDIRQVQLAKGAILSGFITLLDQAGIRMEDLDKVMIAGQFGAHLPADSLVGTGILPKEVKDKLVYVGNSSKTGAYMALMSSKVKKEMEELAGYMDYMELGATGGYERLFSSCLILSGCLIIPFSRFSVPSTMAATEKGPVTVALMGTLSPSLSFTRRSPSRMMGRRPS